MLPCRLTLTYILILPLLHRSPQESWVGGEEAPGFGYVEVDQSERCYLVGVQPKSQKNKYGYSVLESLEELGRLAETAGLEVIEVLFRV